MSSKRFRRKLSVKIGDEITFLAVSWDAGWDFDYPSLLIDPIVQFNSDSSDTEFLIEEDVCQKICGLEKLKDENVERLEKFYGFNVDTLRRKAKKILSGEKVKFQYGNTILHVTEMKIKFIIDEDFKDEGYLTAVRLRIRRGASQPRKINKNDE